MIKHIVIFKLTPPYTPEDKEASIKKLYELFEPLGRKLGFTSEYRVGININEAEYAGDLVIDSLFASPEDLTRYQSSREHQVAVATGSTIRKTKIVVDYLV